MRINVSISDDMNKNIEVICSRWGCSKSDLVSIVLGQYLECFDKRQFVKSFDMISAVKRDEYAKMQEEAYAEHIKSLR